MQTMLRPVYIVSKICPQHAELDHERQARELELDRDLQAFEGPDARRKERHAADTGPAGARCHHRPRGLARAFSPDLCLGFFAYKARTGDKTTSKSLICTKKMLQAIR